MSLTEQIQKDFDQIMEDHKNSLGESIASKAFDRFEKSPDFNSEQKEKLKTNLPKLSQKINDKVSEIVKKGFKPDSWVRESLKVNLTKNFTVNELKQLVSLFSGEGGQALINSFKKGFENNKDLSDLENLDEKSASKLSKFFNSPLAHKFSEKLFDHVETDLKNKTDLWGKNIEKQLTTDAFAPIIIGYITEYSKVK